MTAAAGGLAVALDASTRPGSVAIAVEGPPSRETRRAEVALDAARPHASDLLPALDELLRSQGLDRRRIQRVAVGLGPGSFTGLRVACATATGLALGCGARLLGVPSSEAEVFARLAPGQQAYWLAPLRRGELALARYRRTEDEVEVLEPLAVAPAAEIGSRLAPELGFLTARECAEELGLARDPRWLGPFERALAPAVLDLALRRFDRRPDTPAAELEPLYLAPFRSGGRPPSARSTRRVEPDGRGTSPG